MNLGRAIRLVRTSKGMTQATLGDKAGCTNSYISVIEKNGGDDISLTTLKKLANGLDTPLVFLVLLAADEGDLNGISQDVVNQLSALVLKLLRDTA